MNEREHKQIIGLADRLYEIREELGYNVADMCYVLDLEPLEYISLETGDPDYSLLIYEVLLYFMETYLEEAKKLRGKTNG